MALGKDHFHEVIQTKVQRAFSNQWSLSGKREEARKGLHFSEASLNTCLSESIKANAFYNNNKYLTLNLLLLTQAVEKS